jgi:hypothetical protein
MTIPWAPKSRGSGDIPGACDPQEIHGDRLQDLVEGGFLKTCAGQQGPAATVKNGESPNRVIISRLR